jgi:hypothetical protein
MYANTYTTHSKTNTMWKYVQGYIIRHLHINIIQVNERTGSLPVSVSLEFFPLPRWSAPVRFIVMDDKTPHVCMGCGHYSARTDTLRAKWICDVCHTLTCVFWRCRRCHVWLGHGSAILQRYNSRPREKIQCRCFDAPLEVDRVFVPTPSELQVLIENTVKVGSKMPVLHDLQNTLIQQTDDEMYVNTRSFIASTSMSVMEELYILQSTGDVDAYMTSLVRNRQKLSVALLTDLVVNAVLMQMWSVVIPTASVGYDFGTYCTRMGFELSDVTPSNFEPRRWCDKPESLGFKVDMHDLSPADEQKTAPTSTEVWHIVSNIHLQACIWKQGETRSNTNTHTNLRDKSGIRARELEQYKQEAYHRDTLCDRYWQRWVHQIYKIDQAKISEFAGRSCKLAACMEYERILREGPSSDPLIPFTPQRRLQKWDCSDHVFITDKCWLLVTAFARLICAPQVTRVLVFGGVKPGETSQLEKQCKACTVFCRVRSRHANMKPDGMSFGTTACYDSVVSNDVLRRVGPQNICISLNLLTTIAGKLRTLSQGLTSMAKLLRPNGFLIFCQLSLDKIRAFLPAKSTSIQCRFGYSITIPESSNQMQVAGRDSSTCLRVFNGYTDHTPHSAVQVTVRIKDEEKEVFAWSSESIKCILHTLRMRTVIQTPLNTATTPDTNTVFMDYNGIPDIGSFYDLWLVKSTL